jgi:hypothetical protein
MSFLAFIGGLLFSFGLVAETVGLGRLRGGLSQGVAFGAGIGLCVAFFVLRAFVRSKPTRLACAVAGICTLILLSVFASMAQTTDTVEMAYRVQMAAELNEIRDAERVSRRDSGKYTLRPALVDPVPDSTPTVVFTRDGWTASVEHARLPGMKCVMFEGSEPIWPATAPGEAQCSDPPIEQADFLVGGAFMLIGALLVAVAGTVSAKRAVRAE